jgi:hypothetical protein
MAAVPSGTIKKSLTLATPFRRIEYGIEPVLVPRLP